MQALMEKLKNSFRSSDLECSKISSKKIEMDFNNEFQSLLLKIEEMV